MGLEKSPLLSVLFVRADAITRIGLSVFYLDGGGSTVLPTSITKGGGCRQKCQGSYNESSQPASENGSSESRLAMICLNRCFASLPKPRIRPSAVGPN